jgi:hypothetical protein
VFYLWDADSNANFYTDCHTDSNSYDYTYPDAKRRTYGHSDSYGATESYTNGHIHGYAECYGDSYCYSYTYSETNAHCPASRNTKGAALPTAAPGRAALIWFKERRSPWPAVASAKAASPPS